MAFRDRYGLTGKTRIDTRPRNSPATQAGMRNVHRDMSGKVIGGYTASGQALGTKAGKRGQGVRLGSQNASKPAWRAASAPTAIGGGPETVAASGDLLKKRKDLFSQMKKTGAAGVTPAMQQQATALGVTGSGWRRAVGKLSSGPGTTAAGATAPNSSSGRPLSAGVKPLPATGVTGGASRPKPAVAQSIVQSGFHQKPIVGKALAKKNVAGKGMLGAVADYEKRTGGVPLAERTAKRRTDKLMAMGTAAGSLSPQTKSNLEAGIGRGQTKDMITGAKAGGRLLGRAVSGPGSVLKRAAKGLAATALSVQKVGKTKPKKAAPPAAKKAPTTGLTKPRNASPAIFLPGSKQKDMARQAAMKKEQATSEARVEAAAKYRGQSAGQVPEFLQNTPAENVLARLQGTTAKELRQRRIDENRKNYKASKGR